MNEIEKQNAKKGHTRDLACFITKTKLLKSHQLSSLLKDLGFWKIFPEYNAYV